MVNCLLLASYYFSVALEAEQDKPTVYGLKEVIFILLTQVVSMQDKVSSHSHPFDLSPSKFVGISNFLSAFCVFLVRSRFDFLTR